MFTHQICSPYGVGWKFDDLASSMIDGLGCLLKTKCAAGGDAPSPLYLSGSFHSTKLHDGGHAVLFTGLPQLQVGSTQVISFNNTFNTVDLNTVVLLIWYCYDTVLAWDA